MRRFLLDWGWGQSGHGGRDPTSAGGARRGRRRVRKSAPYGWRRMPAKAPQANSAMSLITRTTAKVASAVCDSRIVK